MEKLQLIGWFVQHSMKSDEITGDFPDKLSGKVEMAKLTGRNPVNWQGAAIGADLTAAGTWHSQPLQLPRR
jgi:hypothetical protein